MSVITLGLYNIVWFYKNFQQIKATSGESMWPVARAIFQLFFTINLFKRIHEAAEAKDIAVGWSYKSLGAAFIVLTILFNQSDRISPIVGALCLVIVPMLAYITVQVQATANEVQNDSEGSANSRFTVFNLLWCVLGFLVWSLLLLDAVVTFGFLELY